MASLNDIKQRSIPNHIAVIMDGNGRWAQQKGKDRIFGHQQGVETVRKTIETCVEIGVRYLTVYAFSTENWKREPEEVNALMSLFVNACNAEIDNLHKNNVQVKAIGDFSMLSRECTTELQRLIDKTKNNTALTFVIAISYGSRWEIARAAKLIAEQILQNRISIDEIDENLFDNYLQTNQYDIPNPDLLIRTSEEYRLSNFLLWQLAYAELYFTNVLWPDFTREELFKAINDFQRRTRRFGKTTEQIKNELK
ncbi:MAG: isoprenyl transferase [Bacteroidales bacterium]|nr:isoprenyl transferase [Bacteroidales bacterium]MDD4208917.1 isoprenyl transferase [Bacteroidales bacterium]